MYNLFMNQNAQNARKAIIFIGIPASGKSAFYARNFADGYERINLDTLHTRRKEQMLVDSCLQEGKSFVVDNTNPTKADRQRYIAAAKAAGYRVEGYFFQSIVRDCKERNARREGKARVPDAAFGAVSSKLEMPCLDEGFDALYFVRITGGDFVCEDWEEGLS